MEIHEVLGITKETLGEARASKVPKVMRDAKNAMLDAQIAVERELGKDAPLFKEMRRVSIRWEKLIPK